MKALGVYVIGFQILLLKVELERISYTPTPLSHPLFSLVYNEQPWGNNFKNTKVYLF